MVLSSFFVFQLFIWLQIPVVHLLSAQFCLYLIEVRKSSICDLKSVEHVARNSERIPNSNSFGIWTLVRSLRPDIKFLIDGFGFRNEIKLRKVTSRNSKVTSRIQEKLIDLGYTEWTCLEESDVTKFEKLTSRIEDKVINWEKKFGKRTLLAPGRIWYRAARKGKVSSVFVYQEFEKDDKAPLLCHIIHV